MTPLRVGRFVLALTSAAVLFVGGAGLRAQQSSSQVPQISPALAAHHRLWVLVFDLSSMDSTDLALAQSAAIRWVDASVLTDDLVSIVTVATDVATPQNFTIDVDRLRTAIQGMKIPDPAATSNPDLQERDLFNNDLRYRGLKTVCTGLQPIPQKKALMLFTALRPHPGADNQVEIRAASDACGRANASINPIDVRAAR